VTTAADAGDWDAPPRATDEPALVVDVEGFEGPLDLLLSLARTQKLDLARISILALAEQYLAFISEARRLRLEIAADYLVMAAWLAYLKSRLLVPAPPSADEPSGEDLAESLAFRLRRLEAIREAAARLAARGRLGRDVFARGAPEPVVVAVAPRWSATLYDLLSAYAAQRQRRSVTSVRVARRTVWSLIEAREVLERMIGRLPEWVAIDELLVGFLTDPATRAGVKASAFSASLELVREGVIDLQQTEAFAPLYLRTRPAEDPDERPV